MVTTIEPENIRVEDEEYGWLIRLPPAIRDYGLLARWDRPIGTWLLLIPCWWGQALASGALRLDLALLFAIGAITMRGAGCTINDLADRDFDARVERTRNRPLAAGRLTATQAILFVALQCLVGLIVLLLLPIQAQLVALASIPLVVAYPFMKRITFWPQAFLGLTFNWGILVGAAATGAPLDATLLLYAAGIAWTLGYDTIYAHQDKDDDRLIGVKSTALLFGARTRRMVGLFYAFTLVLAAAALLAGGQGVIALLVLLLPAAHFGWQVTTLQIDDRVNCLARFRSNRIAGLAILAAIVAGFHLP